MKDVDVNSNKYMTRFNRDFYSETDAFTYIGEGEWGGKARGLAAVKEIVVSHYSDHKRVPIIVNIPRLTVITTPFFDHFMEKNDLYDIAFSNLSDERIAHHFLEAELPVDLAGDLKALTAHVHAPLAVRSSSLLEDSLKSPFAGVYETKMIPNNQPGIDTRFRKLSEAIKLVYASTFFNNARCYMQATPHNLEDEKMAVIIQEVVGLRHHDRFYPNISGVARSYNFYPANHAKPEEGVVNLALGLGKTIVDGGAVWTYSPQYPEVTPPCHSIHELLEQTQLNFWAVNMEKPPAHDPVKETEFLVKLTVKEAEYDNTLGYIASTYDYGSDHINLGIGFAGSRFINPGSLSQVNLLPVNEIIKSILKECKGIFKAHVEIEFAVTIDMDPGSADKIPIRFGLLQVRPMIVPDERVVMKEKTLTKKTVLAASDNVMGNGCMDNIRDILYVVPETFSLKNTHTIAAEISHINRQLVETKTPYLLVGFGRWGTSNPSLGIPVNWGQISGARVIIESQSSHAAINLSQGSHFFHNISNSETLYFSLKKECKFPIDWEWLNKQRLLFQGDYIRHVRLKSPLLVKVDGRKRSGVIFK